MPIDTKATLLQLARMSKSYDYYDAYYSGNQPLTYTTKKYRDAFAAMLSRYAENLCPAVIEPLNDRLVILGLEIEGEDNNDVATKLWEFWRDSRMQRKSKNAHFKALLAGNSYVIVWPNPRTGPEITVQNPGSFALVYNDDGAKDYGVKLWFDVNNYAHLTAYYADRIERYVSATASKSRNVSENRKFDLTETIPNPYGQVPVFHFTNSVLDNSDLYGLSELKDVVPVQDALNKSVTDMLVAMEFGAYRQRWATGISIETDETTGEAKPQFQPGQDRVWATENAEARFGSFEASELDQFIRVHDMFTLSVARITGVPLHHMLINSTVFPSGEALKTAESRFASKVEDRQVVFGETWEDVLKFCAEMMGIRDAGRVDIKWKMAIPQSDREFGEVAALKKGYGVSNKMLQREAGYTEEQITQMEEENKANAPVIPAGNTVPNNNGEQEEDS